jgi:hypothetical protein
VCFFHPKSTKSHPRNNRLLLPVVDGVIPAEVSTTNVGEEASSSVGSNDPVIVKANGTTT